MANSEVSRLKFNDTTYEIADEMARESVGTALAEVASVEAKADAYNTALSGRITNLENSSGAVLVAKTRTAMTDTNKIYVYTGTTTTASGVTYTPGHWYYHNGSKWTDGGEYNQNLDAIDATLTQSNKGADAKVTGDRFGLVESDISDLKKHLSITNKSFTISQRNLEQGIYNSAGDKGGSSTRIRTINKIRIARGATVRFTSGTNIQSWCYVSYDETGVKFFASGWMTGNSLIKISSETGYVGLIFKKDDSTPITPSFFDATVSVDLCNEYNITFSLEHGALTSSDTNRFYLGYYDSHRRNKYPLILNGCEYIMLPIGSGSIMIFDSNGTFIENHVFSSNGNAFFDIPSNAVYMDVDIVGTVDAVTITLFGVSAPYFSKRIYRNNGDTIRQDITIGGTLYTNIAYKLPSNYSAEGDPVPIVLWIAGNNGYPQIGSGFPASAVTGLEYLRDEGYAILQVFSWGSYYAKKYPLCGKDQPYPIPISKRCLKMGIEYFCDRYNIDANNIHVIGRSFGGQMSLHYALHPFEGLKSVTMFDPVIDFLSMRGRFSDARKALAEELSFKGDLEDFYDINEDGSTSTGVNNYYFSDRCMPIWEQNMPDVIRLNVAWDNLTDGTLDEHYADAIADARNWWNNGKYTVEGIYDNDNYHVTSEIPVMMVYALDDASTPTQAISEKINQLRNAGNPTEEYTVPTGGHDAVSFNTTYAQTVTTDLGIICADVPIGWIVAHDWIKKNA